MRPSLLAAVALLTAAAVQAADPIIVKLWPEGAPEKPGFKSEPEKAEKGKDGILRVSNVSDPTIAIYKPEKPNGTAVVVCPGGGYGILAYEHEGSQVCEFLNSIGVTGVLLKYRVPRRDKDNPAVEPLQDAQRAIGLTRHHAAEWGIKPDRIGILGFSAGGNLTILTALHQGERTYKQDPALDGDAKPNFMIPVYPAYLVDKANLGVLLPGFTVTKDSPPACFIHANDDPWSASGSALLYIDYKKLSVPAEIHVYAKGGHGFGMKKGDLPVNAWPQRVAEWLRSMGLLDG